jgi:predicted Zn finger-like uncharacterized protein
MGFAMPVITDCPSCGRQLRVPDSLLGRNVKCTGCGTTFTAPEGGLPAEAVQERREARDEERRPAPAPKDYEPWEEEDEDAERPRRGRRRRRRRDPGRTAAYVLPPAICLIVVGVLGLLVTSFNVVFALTAPPPHIDPNVPPFLRQIQENSVGPRAAVIQAVFVMINLAIVLSAVMMVLRRAYGLAVAGSILAMLNCGSLCCILGLPIGIWAVIVLCMEDVKESFG